MASIDRTAFRSTVLRELRSAWETLRRRHQDERFYGFGVYTTDVVDYLTVTASTEEGLAAVASAYVDRDGGDPALREASLRWSPCDSPLHQEGEGLLCESDRLRSEGPDPYDETPEADETVAMVIETAVEALQELDDAGFFGTGADRAQLVLGIWKGDQSDEERVEFVRRLNPQPVADRFAREIAEGTQAFFRLHP
jgi:hypothetical protein